MSEMHAVRLDLGDEPPERPRLELVPVVQPEIEQQPLPEYARYWEKLYQQSEIDHFIKEYEHRQRARAYGEEITEDEKVELDTMMQEADLAGKLRDVMHDNDKRLQHLIKNILNGNHAISKVQTAYYELGALNNEPDIAQFFVMAADIVERYVSSSPDHRIRDLHLLGELNAEAAYTMSQNEMHEIPLVEKYESRALAIYEVLIQHYLEKKYENEFNNKYLQALIDCLTNTFWIKKRQLLRNLKHSEGNIESADTQSKIDNLRKESIELVLIRKVKTWRRNQFTGPLGEFATLLFFDQIALQTGSFDLSVRKAFSREDRPQDRFKSNGLPRYGFDLEFIDDTENGTNLPVQVKAKKYGKYYKGIAVMYLDRQFEPGIVNDYLQGLAVDRDITDLLRSNAQKILASSSSFRAKLSPGWINALEQVAKQEELPVVQ